MATFLHVTHGPDAGRKFSIDRETVRVGNDSNANVRLKDPQLEGQLVIRWRNGVHHVSNQLSSPIWYRRDDQRELFGQGEERVWYDGVRLQPTANTELLLQAEADPAAIISGAGLYETTTVQKKSSSALKTIAIAGIGLALLILLESGNSGTHLPPQALEERGNTILNDLQTADRVRTSSAPFNADWHRLAETFHETQLADRGGDYEDAGILYLKCSQILASLRKELRRDSTIELSEAHQAAMEELPNVLNQRKLKLSR